MCNYWAGSERFWREYMAFCMPIYSYIQNDLPEPMRSRLLTKAGERVSATYFAYIFERLMTTFLILRRQDIKVLSYTFSEAELRAICPAPFVNLVLDLQAFSGASPDDSPDLKRRLEECARVRAEQFRRRGMGYRLTRKLWHLLPNRRRILYFPYVRRFAKFCEDLFTPGIPKN
jgi:hypothetical protein